MAVVCYNCAHYCGSQDYGWCDQYGIYVPADKAGCDDYSPYSFPHYSQPKEQPQQEK